MSTCCTRLSSTGAIGIVAIMTLTAGAMQPEIDDWLIRIQDGDAAVRRAALEQAGPMGDKAIAPLADLMAGGDPDITQTATDALASIARHAARPETPAPHRKAVARELGRLLAADRPQDVRAEALRLLGPVADDEAVGAMARLLNEPELRETACVSLQGVSGEAATKALVAALAKAPAKFQVRIIEALGQRRDVVAVPPLLAVMKTPDMAVGYAAVEALAAIGEPAGDVFTPAAFARLTDDGLDRLADVYFLYADNRAAKGDTDSAKRLCQAVLERATRGPHRCAAVAQARARASETQPSDRRSPEAIGVRHARRVIDEAVERLNKFGVETRVLARQAGFITTWQLTGPFPNPDNSGYEKGFFPEQKVDLQAGGEVAGKTFKWKKVAVESVPAVVDLLDEFEAKENVAAYGYAEIESKAARDVKLKIGSNDGIVVWLNGERLFGTDASRDCVPDQDVVKAKFQKGVNTLLVKILQGDGDWQFCVRVTDSDNHPLDLSK